jgi:hypothetical protein
MLGVGKEFTVTSTVATLAHSPLDGVNVYVVTPALLVLIDDGFHVPSTPLFEVVGNTSGVSSTH